VFSQEELRAIGQVASEHNLLIISDEVVSNNNNSSSK
jgi:aspartate/methionine/tyrosine aminotransferase